MQLNGKWSEKQLWVLNGIAKRSNRFHLVYGQPRSGKTAAAVAGFVRESLKFAGKTYGLIAVTLRQCETIAMNEVSSYCRGAGIPFGKIADKRYRVGHNEFHLFSANNNRAAIAIQGYTLAGFYIDEIVNIPETVMLEITNRLSEVERAKVIMTANTGNPASWFYKDYLKRHKEIGLKYYILNMSDNPSLSEEFKQSIIQTSTGFWYKRRIQNLWVAPFGNVYVMPDIADLPSDWKEAATAFYLTVDPADSSETHAVLVARIGGRYYAVGEWVWNHTRRGQLPHRQQVREIKAWTDGLGISVRGIVYDSASPNFGAELHSHFGSHTMMSQKDKNMGLRRVQHMLDNEKLIITRGAPDLYEQMAIYHWDEKKAEQGLDEPTKGNDHGCDAIRYFAMTVV